MNVGETDKWGRTLDANENHNFLNGQQCPKCRHCLNFFIKKVVVNQLELYDKGFSREFTSIELPDETVAICGNEDCHHVSTIGGLKDAYKRTHVKDSPWNPCPLCNRDMNKVGKRSFGEIMCLQCAAKAKEEKVKR